jgi:hypothetical protein
MYDVHSPSCAISIPANIANMRFNFVNILVRAYLLTYISKSCNAMPQASATAVPSPTPSVAIIPWPTKLDKFREYLLQLPDRNATKGYWNGPGIQKTFADGQCLQVRFYNWDCNYDITYKMRGVVNWLDDTGIRNGGPNSPDPYRYYLYGYYVDPDDGWNFYSVSRLAFGFCNNRGPQSSCGITWCEDKDGHSSGNRPPFEIPAGANPWVDPNNRSKLCPWMKEDDVMGRMA